MPNELGRPTASIGSARVGALVLLVAAIGVPAVADIGPPAHLQIRERDPGRFELRWRVPRVLPPRALPRPELPESCEPVARESVESLRDAWLFTQEWRCMATLAGETIGLSFPFPDFALTTVARVELDSGDRFAHVLTPGDPPWTLPRGIGPPDPLRAARRTVLAGARHALESWVHLAFLLVAGLFGGLRPAVRTVTAFAAGQIGGAILASLGVRLGAAPAEFAFALVVALLAREALRPAGERLRLLLLAACGGLAHGAGNPLLLATHLGEEGAGLLVQLGAIVGMDAVHLVGAAIVVGLSTRLLAFGAGARLRAGLVYVAGVSGMALAFGLALGGGTPPGSDRPVLGPAPLPVSDTAAAGARSRRVAPTVDEAPVQSFLAVEPFEIRHEVMMRPGGLAPALALEAAGKIEIADQPALARRLAALVLDGTTLEADGRKLAGIVSRSDFMSVDVTGALPRALPMVEPVDDAVVGVVLTYPTDGVPQEVSLVWNTFPAAVASIPSTLIDPESVRNVVLDPEQPSLTWRNELTEEPIPTVNAVAVEPVSVPLPLVALPLLLLAAIAQVTAFRSPVGERHVAAARVLLALALLLAPVARTSLPIPQAAGRVPSERQARRIVAGLLPNLYRALEYGEEAAIYDRLAVSVTGETLTEIYLEQRRALRMEERGGAQARVEAVEVLEARGVERLESGFAVRSTWTVGGRVTHFGHRHFRQNRYDAELAIVPVDGAWKIRSIRVLEQDRIR